MRELYWMVIGHQKTAWVHTTHVLITMANVQRGKDDKPVAFEDVYPFSEKQQRKQQRERQPDELDQMLEKAQFKRDMLRMIGTGSAPVSIANESRGIVGVMPSNVKAV